MNLGASVVLAHPSADLYGADLQLLETVSALVDAGVRAVVMLPEDGPLVALLRERGATVDVVATPVLRKSLLSPLGLVRLAVQSLAALPRLVGRLRAEPGAPVLVNTVTIPIWVLAGRLVGRRTVVHVHEAEEDGHRLIRFALAAPNLLATALIANSAAAARALADVVPPLGRRITVVHNGVPGPRDEPGPPRTRAPADPVRLALVARLSPRKGVDVALEATALLRSRGHDVQLVVGGTTFPGYEWFEAELRARAARPDLAGHVEFAGYVSPTWSMLEAADVVLVPSRVEPFGNTAVEALLSRRPLVASRTQGLTEIVRDGVTGLAADPGSARSLADAVERFVDDPDLARRLADAGRADGLIRFSPARYRADVVSAILPPKETR